MKEMNIELTRRDESEKKRDKILIRREHETETHFTRFVFIFPGGTRPIVSFPTERKIHIIHAVAQNRNRLTTNWKFILFRFICFSNRTKKEKIVAIFLFFDFKLVAAHTRYWPFGNWSISSNRFSNRKKRRILFFGHFDSNSIEIEWKIVDRFEFTVQILLLISGDRYRLYIFIISIDE